MSPLGRRIGRRRGLIVGAAVGASVASHKAANKAAAQPDAEPATEPQSATGPMETELTELTSLKDRGIITEDEYQAKRKQALGL